MKKSRGFTLIEMLIVIAVIGVLAVAVLSAINPIEQMRKARDTRRRSDAAELLNALERYYTTYEAYPNDYMTDAATSTTCDSIRTAQITTSGIGTLMSSNELKAEFANRISQTGDEVYSGGDFGATDLAVVCYQIEAQTNIDKYSAGGYNYCSSAGVNYACLPE